MNKQQLRDVYTTEQRIESVQSGWRRERTEFVTRHVSLLKEKGFILHSNLTAENASRIIEEELNYFKSLSQSFEWKLYDYDQPENLMELLEAKGFTVEDPEALLVLDIQSQQNLLNVTISSDIQSITDELGIDDIVSLEDKIWGISHSTLGDQLKRDLEDNPDLHLYGAYVNGEIVSAAWMYLHKNTSFGSLWGGSTLPEYRSKGYYTSLLAARVQQAWKKGYPLLTVDASPMSKIILEKRGFQFLATSFPCISPEFE